MIYTDKKLTDFIYVSKTALPNTLCDFVVNKSQTYKWDVHTTYGLNESSKHDIFEGEDNRLFRTGMDKATQLQTIPILDNALKEYEDICGMPPALTTKSPIQLNKYLTGAKMRIHFDHIHSCFDGQKKGIPVISMVGLLNDNFEGGEFVFWDNYVVPLQKGDILFFPSLFLYSHSVKPVLQGTRYSLVTWYW